MFVALGIQHAMHMRRTTHILPSVACLVVPYFSTLSHKRHDFRGEKLLNVKFVLDVLHSFRSQHFTFWEEFIKILSGKRRDLHVRLPLFLSDFDETSIFSTDFGKRTRISNFMKIRPLGNELLHADGRTDRQTRRNQ